MTPTLVAVAAAAILCGVALRWLRRAFVVVTIKGSSMWPLFVTGDRVLVRRAELDAIAREQVVVVEPPRTGPTSGRGAAPGPRWMIKRAVALPGDPVPDDLMAAVGADLGAVVPNGKLLVRGDNAGGSVDSRAYGYVAGDRVLGVAVRRIGKLAPGPPRAR